MKVILAGYPKTGTKTMACALRSLGFSVHDFMEHFWFNGEEWKRIVNVGGSVEDFKRMYENVDAVCDTPVFAFWYDLYQAFPDAKLILPTRDPDSLFKSFKIQMDEIFDNFLYQLLQTITPTGRRYFRHVRDVFQHCFGPRMQSPWHPVIMNELSIQRRLRQHNQDVIQNVPEDRLLIYSVKEGWEPLCKFLGVEVPGVPFPHKNKSGSTIDDFLDEHPAMQRMKREAIVIGSVFTGLCALALYKMYKHQLLGKLWAFGANYFRG